MAQKVIPNNWFFGGRGRAEMPQASVQGASVPSFMLPSQLNGAPSIQYNPHALSQR